MLAAWPQISVIIPTYGRPRRLLRCLEALAAQDYAADLFEIIVVDDGSEPSLAPVVRPLAAELNIRYLRQENSGPAAARNHGARAARFPYLAFTDDDCVAASSWLSMLAQLLRQLPRGMIGGHTVNALSENPFASSSQLLIDYLYLHFNKNEQAARFFTSNNFVCAAADFWEVGGFDPDIPYAAGEDREFCDRWRYSGRRMIYEPRARIFHYHQLGLVSFVRQHFNYGRGAWLFHQIRRRREQGPVQMEPVSFYWRLLLYPLRARRHTYSWSLVGLMVVTQLANAAGFFFEQVRRYGRDQKKTPGLRPGPF